jgi:cytochrome c peroxidase
MPHALRGTSRLRAATMPALLTAAASLLFAPLPLSAQVGPPEDWRAIFARRGDPPSPPENPLTREKVELGAKLFSDRRLSGRGDRSCASCHQPARAFTDGRRRPTALDGRRLARNTPSLLNLAWSTHYFWDGRAPSLEAQVAMPIEAPDEMNGAWPTILGRLGEDPDLIAGFRQAFPAHPTPSRTSVLQALAAYVRSLVSSPTRFDAWIAGEDRALDRAEVRGFELFTGKAACVLCHVGWRFTDDRFHDIGLASKDAGRGAIPGTAPGPIAFKTPSLRELVLTAPYMHDGSLATLGAVIDHYAGRFVIRPTLAANLNRKLRLAPHERADLVAFLRALSSRGPPAGSHAADGRGCCGGDLP